MPSYSTQGLATKEVAPFWHDAICKSYVPIECRLHEEKGFGASVAVKRFGRTDLSSVTSMAVSYDRNERHIRKSDSDDFLVTLMTKGHTLVEQMNRTSRLGAGDLCLLDTSRPYRFDYPLPYQAIHLKIPRHETERRFPLTQNITASRVAAGGRYTRLVATMLQSTVDLLTDEDHGEQKLEPALLDLIALAFDESFSEPAPGNMRYARIVSKAQEIISARLSDPGFDISIIPQEIGVSNRSLYRAFAQIGTTPARFVMKKRLEAAANIIKSGNYLTVSEVAMACGFNEFSHFSRSFKSEFNETPKSMLDRAIAGRSD